MQQTDCNIFSSCHVSLPIPGCDRLSPYPYHDQFALFPCHTLVTAWFSVRPSGGAPEAGLFAMDPISFASHEEPPWRCEVSRRRRLYPVVVVKGRRSRSAEAKGARYQDRQSRVEAEARARESLGLDIMGHIVKTVMVAESAEIAPPGANTRASTTDTSPPRTKPSKTPPSPTSYELHAPICSLQKPPATLCLLMRMSPRRTWQSSRPTPLREAVE
jgi:hypothetical protein